MDCQATKRIVVEALKAFAKQLGTRDVVLGISGGIDSALTAALCKEAFGAAHVHGVILPGPFTTEASLRDGYELIHHLGIDVIQMSITDQYTLVCQEYKNGTGEALTGIAAQNVQARLRMVALMALSNAKGWTLINTDNKSEACMGYSTLYGDTAGAFAPLGGLYKTQVFALARFINKEAGREIIPDEILVKAPSAELAEGQTDEQSMGVGYETLDQILEAYVDKGETADCLAQRFDAALVQRIIRTYESYAYKRALLPPYPTL